MSLYFVGPKRPSGSCYISCFLTDSTALIELKVQSMKITSSEHMVYINCSKCQKKPNLCIQHFLSLQFTCIELVILSSYCGLVDAKVGASDKDLPVQTHMLMQLLINLQIEVRY